MIAAGGAALWSAVQAVLDGLTTVAGVDRYARMVERGPEVTIPIQSPPDFERLSLISRLFSDRAPIVKLVGGTAHYRYPGRMHPDDLLAARVLQSYARAISLDCESLGTGSWDTTADFWLNGSFVCTGSPVSNLKTRQVLQYRYVDEQKPELGLKRVDSPDFELPYEFILDQKTISAIGRNKHHQAEPGLRVLNWSIRGPDGMPLTPLDDEEDLLLISRLPNMAEREERFRKYKNTVTIFSGTHGVGTAAIELLLADVKILDEMASKTRDCEFWQVLVRVNGMMRGFHRISHTERPIPTSLDPKIEVSRVVI